MEEIPDEEKNTLSKQYEADFTLSESLYWGLKEWGWLIGGIILIIIGLIFIYAHIYLVDVLEFLLIAFVCIASGIGCLIYKRFDIAL